MGKLNKVINMKHIIFFVFIFYSHLSLFAAYRPFIVEGKTWEMEVENLHATKVDTYTLVLSGDTLINGVLYKKLLSNDDGYIGAFREENRKVYFLSSTSSKESLHYDFTLHKGDRYVHVISSSFQEELEVYIDDSIYTCGNTLHRIGLYYPNNDEYASSAMVQNIWIEGVGSLLGPNHDIYLGWVGADVRVRSCRVGNEILYRDPMHQFIMPDVSWVDGYIDDTNVYMNRHTVSGSITIGEQVYTQMHVQQYVSSLQQGNVSVGVTTEYLLREDTDGEAWLRMKSPQAMLDLYGIVLDENAIRILEDQDLYLFNTRAHSNVYMTYGSLAFTNEEEKKWQRVKDYVSELSYQVLENNSYTWRRTLRNDDVPPILANVGWLKYGPFWGLGETTKGVERIFPVFFKNKEVVYRDDECFAYLQNIVPSFTDIITGVKALHTSKQNHSALFDLQGRRIGKAQEGINIIRNADGTTKKVLTKH